MADIIWTCFLPMKKGTWDNDYVFYSDGTIIHKYDVSMKKYNIKKDILPADISEDDRRAILSKVDNECPQEYIEKVKKILII